ncbi:MAG: site-specific DNA-methyltransferase [Phycisphaerales bacterium]
MAKKTKQRSSGRQDPGIPSVAVFGIEELQTADYNPRVISDDALTGLRNSVQRFGCVEPIVVNVRGGGRKIVGGHQRLKALQALGIKKVLCVTVNCTPAEEKLLNLTLNNPQIQGRFVKEIESHIAQLQGELAGDSAFMDLRITAMQRELGIEGEKTGRVPDDDIPKPPKKAVTKPGDLWHLVEHRLLCGDSTKPEDVARLMGEHKAKLFATDPPYCVDYTGKNRPSGTGKDWSDVYREIEIKDARGFVKAFYEAGLPHVVENAPLYLWHADRRRAMIEEVCEELGLLVHQPIIWAKPCVLQGYSYYGWRHEPCLLMWRKKHKPAIDIAGRRITNRVTSVWPVGYQKTGDPTTPEYYTDIWELDYDGKKHPTGIAHPTVKPVEVFAIPMRVHTKPGDICFEPFSGSGTQIIAAEKLGRRCLAIEKEPVFVDVAVKRWEEWSGRKAERKGKGKKS